MREETLEYLSKQGLSEKEISEIKPLVQSIEYHTLDKRPNRFNWFAVARIEADYYSVKGTTEKIRSFSKRILEKLKRFS